MLVLFRSRKTFGVIVVLCILLQTANMKGNLGFQRRRYFSWIGVKLQQLNYSIVNSVPHGARRGGERRKCRCVAIFLPIRWIPVRSVTAEKVVR